MAAQELWTVYVHYRYQGVGGVPQYCVEVKVDPHQTIKEALAEWRKKRIIPKDFLDEKILVLELVKEDKFWVTKKNRGGNRPIGQSFCTELSNQSGPHLLVMEK